MNKAAVERFKLWFTLSPHATRTTASTMLSELGFRHEVTERQIAHREKNPVRRAYNRADYLEGHRQRMQQLADMVEGFAREEKITPIESKAA